MSYSYNCIPEKYNCIYRKYNCICDKYSCINDKYSCISYKYSNSNQQYSCNYKKYSCIKAAFRTTIPVPYTFFFGLSAKKAFQPEYDFAALPGFL